MRHRSILDLMTDFAVLATTFLLLAAPNLARADEQTARVVRFYGYDDCIRLNNGETQVTLCPAAGGRVLEYAWKGRNALYLVPGNEGWTYEESEGRPGSMLAGRFDIGPEQTIPSHPQLWMGRWTGEIIGPGAARLTSPPDQATGVQLIREFLLDEHSTRLECRQTMRNISDEPKEYCYWCRTFALGGGVCVIPLTEPSRFPNRYVMYERTSRDSSDTLINFRPQDPHIRVRDGFLEITGPPASPKLGMDTYAGWFAYVMPNDLMFVKQFPADPDRVYNEVAGLTMSVWYPDGPMCELEPIGPRERLSPGAEAKFTETWWLLPHTFPGEGETVDLPALAKQVASDAR
ncbi:MAG: hypothetical protein KF861_08235 [Planctomycetaceae bacterium]|nr:hypothetical protein [Planctomycetaceae bacterium]